MAEYCASTVRFSEEELDLAQLFKAYGLNWNPCVGHYVLDQSSLIDYASPFQDRVYFIQDLEPFLERSETIENLEQRVCWLPTAEQARQLLDEHGIPESQVTEHLKHTNAVQGGTERLELYRMLEEQILGGFGL